MRHTMNIKQFLTGLRRWLRYEYLTAIRERRDHPDYYAPW